MNARRIGLLVGAATLVASGAYLFIYLYRWEWNRATIAGIFFLAAEGALVAAVLVERVRRLEQKLDAAVAPDGAVTARARERLADSAPAPRDHFAWMARSMDRTSVFVPVLMGAGIVLSGLAWLVERMARATARPVLEKGLAARLTPLAVPTSPIAGDDREAPGDAVALLVRPGARS